MGADRPPATQLVGLDHALVLDQAPASSRIGDGEQANVEHEQLLDGCHRVIGDERGTR